MLVSCRETDAVAEWAANVIRAPGTVRRAKIIIQPSMP
jgi:hypothetical protein